MNTILIVDDSPTDAYLAQKCAANLFTEVRTAHNVDCAFQELDAFQPSVILMDWTLDDLKNGISLIAEIREREDDSSTVPIIVCTGRSMPADKLIAANAGASAYIVKPITPETLAEACARVVPGFKPSPAV
ncbi:TPA: response regulator [Pseudomonas putida]|uniref:response regulator n=1 Tax=unclassified Pseudomonas TaxID=196821 RepID=UPI000C7CC85F|nr:MULTISPECIES: response regulator [unclassified Pseudomonas]PLP85812.1 response regulator [Pseudomonas sp. FFUP_PS_41]QDQ70551.1 response regulator [Pseudomonas sp.]